LVKPQLNISNLEIAETYVDSHAKRAQARYVSRYNLRTRDKTFSVGESVLVLTPDSTSSKVFSRWKGPGVVPEIKSKNSYMVELDGVRRHINADKLRKYHVQVDEVCCDLAEYNTVTAAAATATVVGHCAILFKMKMKTLGI